MAHVACCRLYVLPPPPSLGSSGTPRLWPGTHDRPVMRARGAARASSRRTRAHGHVFSVRFPRSFQLPWWPLIFWHRFDTLSTIQPFRLAGHPLPIVVIPTSLLHLLWRWAFPIVRATCPSMQAQRNGTDELLSAVLTFHVFFPFFGNLHHSSRQS